MKRILLAVLFLSLPLTAYAQECDSDADCPEGTICVPAPCACAVPACVNPEDCEEFECPPCENKGECMAEDEFGDFGGWYSNECSADADCPMGFTCQEITVGSCGGFAGECPPCECACKEGEECNCEAECPPCKEVEPPDCKEETLKVCVFEPTECKADSDCAEGFECIEQQTCYDMDGGCACTSCACAPCPEGEECPPCDCPDEPEECTCDDTPFELECETYGSFCVPKQIECTTAGDCPEGWECAKMPTPCPAIACDCACKEGEECDCSDACPEMACEDEGKSYCLPGGWYDAGFASPEALGSDSFMEKGVTAAADRNENGGETHKDGGEGQEVSDEDGAGGKGETAKDDNAGGCTISMVATGGATLLALMVLTLAVLFGLRRRAVSVR